jgi:lysozyme
VNEEVLDLAGELAKPFEGLHKLINGLVHPYHDPVGFPTQGYGHLLSRQVWAPLDQWPPQTPEDSLMWLEQDMSRALQSVLRLVKVELAVEQAAALCDFTYNCGGGNLQVSTLLRLVNREEFEAAADEFPKWVYARGVRLRGLVRRRAAERDLWLSVA